MGTIIPKELEALQQIRDDGLAKGQKMIDDTVAKGQKMLDDTVAKGQKMLNDGLAKLLKILIAFVIIQLVVVLVIAL